MYRIHPIETLDLPALAPYRTMRQQVDHYRDRLFVAEGLKVVERLLDSGLEVVSLLIPPGHLDGLRLRLAARPEAIDVYTAEKALLEQLTGFSMYQGVLACGRVPPPAELDVVCGTAVRPRFLVAADGLSNAENLGGIVRHATAFGAQGLIVGETCVSPYLRRAVRASMGNLFRLPVIEPASLVSALQHLRRRGFRCVGAHPHTERRWLPEAALAEDCCIVLGSEGDGLSAAVQDACDELVAVPMASGVDSLNVTAAGVLFFYEVWRQRNTVPHPFPRRSSTPIN